MCIVISTQVRITVVREESMISYCIVSVLISRQVYNSVPKCDSFFSFPSVDSKLPNGFFIIDTGVLKGRQTIGTALVCCNSIGLAPFFNTNLRKFHV